MFKEIEVYNEPMSVAVPCDHEWANLDEIDMLELNGKTSVGAG